MLYAYIAVLIITVFLTVFAVIAVKSLSARVSVSIRKKNLQLLSEYDDIIEEKSRMLSLIQSRVNLAEEELKKDSAQVQPKVDLHTQMPHRKKSAEMITGLYDSDYKDEKLADYYRVIRNNFDAQPSDFILDKSDGNPMGSKAEVLLSNLSPSSICSLLSISSVSAKELLLDSLDEDGKQLLSDYCSSGDSFDVIGFYDYLKNLAALSPSKPRVYVPKDMRTHDDNKDFSLVESIGICEGFQIEKDGVLYDYSVQRRDISG